MGKISLRSIRQGGWFGWQSWCVVCLLGSGLLLAACNETPTPSPTPTQAPAGNATKIDTVLLELFVKYQTAQGSEQDKQKAALDYAKQQGWINSKDEITFEVEVDSAADFNPVKDKIVSLGGRVMTQPSPNPDIPQTKMRVAVPESTLMSNLNGPNRQNFLTNVADFKGVKSINIITTREISDLHGMPETTSALAALAVQTKNEGVKIMGVDKWQAAGFTGKGVKIGVIDGGFKYYNQFLGSTLPADLQIRDQDQLDGGDGAIDVTVHGTAVLEIIHSLAPDATLIPVAVDGSEDEETEAFSFLQSQGVQIISMSMGGHSTPGDGTLRENKIVDGLRAQGILPIFAAGNEGDSHYAGLFNPDAQGFQQFVPGVTRMAIGNPGSSMAFPTSVILNWEQWNTSGGVKPNDLDLFVEDSKGTPLISSQNDQRSKDPIEYVRLKIPPKSLYYIKIRLKPGAPQPTKPFRLHIFTHDVPVQFDVPAMSIGGPADSKGALAVGAVQFDEDVIAYYSSRGPLPDGRLKPDISAPAGVTSAAYALEGEPGFDGTSAACPEAAGLAAVLKSANLSMTADQLAELLKEYTKKLNGSNSPDNDYGYGRLDIGSIPPGNVSPKNNLGPAPTINSNPGLTPTVLGIRGFYPTPAVTPFTAKPNQPTAGPTNTVRPGPTPTAIPSPQPIGPVSFRDTFNDTSTGLPVGGAANYGHNLYEIKPSANQLVWGVYPSSMSVSDFSAQVQTNGISDGGGVYGLVFWENSASDYYVLSVTGDGKTGVQQFSAGSWKTVIAWTTVSSWKAGAANKIGLTAHAGAITILVNDTPIKVGQAQGNGGIGFAAGSYGNGQDATFQNFVLSTSK